MNMNSLALSNAQKMFAYACRGATSRASCGARRSARASVSLKDLARAAIHTRALSAEEVAERFQDRGLRLTAAATKTAGRMRIRTF